MKTHRCKGSLENHMSIRYDKRCDWSYYKGDPAWNLRRLEHDNDYDCTYLSSCCEITYCPFCGEKLEIPKE